MVGSASFRLWLRTWFLGACILGCARSARGATDEQAFCPASVVLETVSVRVYENSDAAGEQLHAACQAAACQALIKWQQTMQSRQPKQPCVARMHAQGCLVGTPFTSLKCTSTICPTSQKCNIVLVRTFASQR